MVSSVLKNLIDIMFLLEKEHNIVLSQLFLKLDTDNYNANSISHNATDITISKTPGRSVVSPVPGILK